MSEPIPVTIESALAADHAALPWVVGPPAGPTGGAIPATAQKALVRLQLSAVAGVTMNVAIYGRDRWKQTSTLLTTITNLQGYTGGETAYEVQNPERYDRIAIYVNGATWNSKTLHAAMVCSAMPGAGDSAAATATAASAALLDDAVATLGSASPAKSFQVTRPDPTYVQLDVDRSTNHADLPGTATGPAGTAIPAWARKAIFQAARAAAFEDPRFPPVQKEELSDIDIEISVLTVPELISVEDPSEYPGKIKVGEDGLIIRGRYGSGLLLPQVATEWKWDPMQFLKHTCQKAGLASDAYKDLSNKVYKFQAIVFGEKF